MGDVLPPGVGAVPPRGSGAHPPYVRAPVAGDAPGRVARASANQLWAPFPDNDPDGARQAMERFYRLVAEVHGERIDPRRASELEVEWWRVHREHQHSDELDESSLIAALSELWAYTYGVEPEQVRLAAEQRALAMRHSDQWVAEGCRLDHPLLEEERAALVRSYAALLAAVHR